MTSTNTYSSKQPEHTYSGKYLFSQKHQEFSVQQTLSERFVFKLARYAFLLYGNAFNEIQQFSDHGKVPLL